MLHHSHIPNQPFRPFLGRIPHFRIEPKNIASRSRISPYFLLVINSAFVSSEQKSSPDPKVGLLGAKTTIVLPYHVVIKQLDIQHPMELLHVFNTRTRRVRDKLRTASRTTHF